MKFFVILIFLSFTYAEDCKVSVGVREFDLTRLSRNIWDLRYSGDQQSNKDVKAKIQLCAPIIDNHQPCRDVNTSVCLYNGTSDVYSAGEFTNDLSSLAREDAETGGFALAMQGGACSLLGAGATKWITNINFVCGKTLGVPEILAVSPCLLHVEWRTSAACRGASDNPEIEVPCYIYGLDDLKYDLSPLIKLSGGYRVETQDGSDFFINVCRAIKRDGATSSCPEKSLACTNTGGTTKGLGDLAKSLLTFMSKDLELVYTFDSYGGSCPSKVQTKIVFKCPARGKTSPPRLVTSGGGCSYVVEWVTEAACPEARLSAHSCKLSSQQHGVDIDLSPLQKGGNKVINVPAKGSTAAFKIDLGVCQNVGCADGDTDVAVCQEQGEKIHSMGKTSEAVIRYADRELSLRYRDGELCHHNAFRRETVVVFTCNHTAGMGSPVYRNEDEDGCLYTLDWQTELACISSPSTSLCSASATANNASIQVDLASLTGQDWAVVTSPLKPEASIELSVCQALKNATCEAGTFVCKTDASGAAMSLGSVAGAPELTSRGVKIRYSTGGACGSGRTAGVELELRCHAGEDTKSPVLTAMSDDGCDYSLTWRSAAACPLSMARGKECKVTDPHDGNVLDLSSLQKSGTASYYKVSHAGYDYYINVCGELGGTKTACDDIVGAAICQVNTHGRAWSLGSASDALTYFDGEMRLTYINGSTYNNHAQTARSSEIDFVCREGAGLGAPEVEVKEDKEARVYSFLWFTSLACGVATSQCTARSGEEQYDLSGLSRRKGQDNWEVAFSDAGKRELLLQLNMCRQLTQGNLAAGSCDPHATACLSSNGTTVASLYQEGAPSVEKKGELKVVLSEQRGSCGAKGEKYSVALTLQCQKGLEDSSPEFVDLEGECRTELRWLTALACVLDEEESEEGECWVTDESSGHLFNLTSLTRKATDPYTATDDSGQTYEFNVCGGVSGCGDKAAICTTASDGKKTLVANLPAKVTYADSYGLSIEYPKPGKTNGMMKVNLQCYIADTVPDPSVRKSWMGEVSLRLPTPLACIPDPEPCRVESIDGKVYDFEDLVKKTSSWTVGSRPDGQRMVVNLCAPVINCPGPGSVGCVGGLNEDARSLGRLQTQRMEAKADGTVVVTYTDGTECPKKPGVKTSTRIILTCGHVEMGPVYRSVSEDCEYVFDWTSTYACPLQRAVGADCKVTEPRYGHVFDLGKLQQDTDMAVNSSDGQYTYYLQVCQGLKGSSSHLEHCAGMAACQAKPSAASFSRGIGVSSSALTYEAGQLQLRYEDGTSPCHKRYNRSTLINFRCSDQQSVRYVAELEDCVYVFEWLTPLACPPVSFTPTCSLVAGGSTYELSRLTLTDGNVQYYDSVARRRFVLNVCRSLVHGADHECPYNSAVCMVQTRTGGKRSYVSVGIAQEGKLTKDKGALNLTYTGGEKCGNGKTWSTVILFFCPGQDEAENAEPSEAVVNEDDCRVTLHWRSRAACPINNNTSGRDCKITMHSGRQVDLTPLKGEYTVDTGAGHNLRFGVCAAVSNSPCSPGHPGACIWEQGGQKRKWVAGQVGGALTSRAPGSVLMTLSGGDPCRRAQANRTTSVRFSCKHGAGIGQPVFVVEESCTYNIDWHTELVCENELACSTMNGSKLIDLSPLVKPSGHYTADILPSLSISAGWEFWVSLCEPLEPVSGVSCPPGAGVCAKTRHGKVLSLGRPSRPRYLKNTDTVVAEFKDGSQCPEDPTSSLTATITFNCKEGPYQNRPRLIFDSHCVYLFEWYTSVVCGETSKKEDLGKTCAYTDPATQIPFSFKDFSGVQHRISSHLGEVSVQACGNDTHHTTGDCVGSAVCLRTSNGTQLSYGSLDNAIVTYSQRLLRIRYNGGYTCRGKNQAYSMITMQCARYHGTQPPTIEMIGTCFVNIIWSTPLVCPPVADKCSGVDASGNLIDLAPLAQMTGAWNTTDSEGNSYWINICQSVHNSVDSGNCPRDAAVCRKSKSGEVQSLGKVTKQIITPKDDEVRVQYFMGDMCRKGGHTSTSIIHVRCGSTLGRPTYSAAMSNPDQCDFHFEWTSRVACRHTGTPAERDGWRVTDAKSRSIYDISPVIHHSRGLFTDGKHQKDVYRYYFGLNSGLTTNASKAGSEKCNGVAICQTKISDKSFYRDIGDLSSVQVYTDTDSVELVYTTTGRCGKAPTKHPRTSIVVNCDRSQSPGSPKFYYESPDCHYVFVWDTIAVCEPVGVAAAPGSQGSGGGGSHRTAIVVALTVVTLVALVLLVAVLLRKQERRAAAVSCVRRVIPCRKGYGNVYQYSTMEDDSLIVV